VALALAAGVVPYWWWHRRVAADLTAALARTDAEDPGWRLAGLEAARPTIPDEENGARVVVAAGKLLPDKWANDVGVDLQSLRLPSSLTPDQAARLRGALDRARPALDEARKLATLPAGRHAIAYARNPLGTRLPDQLLAREVSALLLFAALRAADDGNIGQALADARAGLNAGRSIGDEPVTVSQLMRLGCVASACGVVEYTLARGEASEESLAPLRRLLADEDARPALRLTARADRAFAEALFELLEDEGRTAATFYLSPAENNFGWLLRDRVRSEHPTMLSLMERRIAFTGLPLHEQVTAERDFDTEVALLPEEAKVTRLTAPSARKVGAAFRKHHALVRCLNTVLACESYRRANGRWPATLADLVPAQLAAIPLDPYDGQPLRYRRLPDGVVVYSVGPDGNDDGGTLAAEDPAPAGADIGYRLWNADRRSRAPAEKEGGAP
jgi:hypothetical protein